ncbi:hypothetical protein [Burkholderia oklahomensis]|uniref:hypothetical protein n=1 Tax=Burkholderia oklahomensis TaxID=342113 RepID=UPI002659F267|nr:hypothetical protein [Burkholderia oklahomensis]
MNEAILASAIAAPRRMTNGSDAATPDDGRCPTMADDAAPMTDSAEHPSRDARRLNSLRRENRRSVAPARIDQVVAGNSCGAGDAPPAVRSAAGATRLATPQFALAL